MASYKANTYAEVCTQRSNNSWQGTWSTNGYMHLSIPLLHNCTLFISWIGLLMRSGPLTMWHDQYVLVMVDKFSKWIQLVLLLKKSNKRVAYGFLDQVFNQFEAPTEVPVISCSSQNRMVQYQIF